MHVFTGPGAWKDIKMRRADRRVITALIVLAPVGFIVMRILHHRRLPAQRVEEAATDDSGSRIHTVEGTAVRPPLLPPRNAPPRRDLPAHAAERERRGRVVAEPA